MWKGRDRIPAIIIKQLIPYEAWRRSKSGSEWARQLNGADGRGFSADGVTSDQLNTVHLLFKATRRSCHSTLETNNFFAVHSAIWRQKVMNESLFGTDSHVFALCVMCVCTSEMIRVVCCVCIPTCSVEMPLMAQTNPSWPFTNAHKTHTNTSTRTPKIPHPSPVMEQEPVTAKW